MWTIESCLQRMSVQFVEKIMQKDRKSLDFRVIKTIIFMQHVLNNGLQLMEYVLYVDKRLQLKNEI